MPKITKLAKKPVRSWIEFWRTEYEKYKKQINTKLLEKGTKLRFVKKRCISFTKISLINQGPDLKNGVSHKKKKCTDDTQFSLSLNKVENS